MNMYGYEFYTEKDLLHYGLKGMHWGTRRWQNEDGTFNAAGKERYFGRGTGEDYHPVKSGSQKTVSKSVTRTKTVTKTSNSGDRLKRVAKGAAIAGGVALAAYGAYKVSQMDPAVLAKYKQTATSVLNTASSGAKKAYNSATSDQAKAAYKKVGQTTAKVTKTAAKKTADYVKFGQAKKDVKETAKLIGKAASTAADVAKASPQLMAEYKKGNLPGQQAMKSSQNAQIVRQYKKEHPNTKLSDAEIIENYG